MSSPIGSSPVRPLDIGSGLGLGGTPSTPKGPSESGTIARGGSPLEGRAVSIRPANDSRAPGEVVRQCHERLQEHKSGALGKIARFFGTLIGGAVAIAGSCITAAISIPAMAIAYPIAKIRDAFSSSFAEAKREASDLRSHLGRDNPSGVMHNPTHFKLNGGRVVDMPGLMETYRSALKSPVSQSEMTAYINMGERIVDAINNADPPYKSGPLMVDGKMVKPGLDSARAVSWFMQAKAVADNAGKTGDPVPVLNRGSMVMDDPQGKLYSFLNSAPNSYGRASTHFNERSMSPVSNPFNTGIAGMMAGVTGLQGAQRGIEDFDNKLPSGKGCMVFDKLQGSGGNQQLYMKFESVGMPSVLGVRTHADAESGWSGKVMNRFCAQFRCLGHSLNFISSKFEHKSEWGAHREKVDGKVAEKGKPGTGVLGSFETAMNKAQADLGAGELPYKASALVKDAKHFGNGFMADALNVAVESYRAKGIDPAPSEIRDAIHQLEKFNKSQGLDLGIERKGAEVHASLDTAYLHPRT